jgi:hypothetical protein
MSSFEKRSNQLSDIFKHVSRYQALDEIVKWLVVRHKLPDLLEALAHAARDAKH